MDDLVLLKIKTLKLKNLKWEKSKEGKVFPHLYSFLNLKDVRNIHKIILKKNGLHSISFINQFYDFTTVCYISKYWTVSSVGRAYDS